MRKQPALAAATYAVGFHYPDSNPGSYSSLTRPLWASEDSSTVDPPDTAPPTPRPRKQPGGGCLIRTINENYVRGNITATIVWNLVMARYPQLRWDYTGLIAATDPFNGHYDVLPPVWAAAHTTQFTAPGWRLVRVGHGSGYLKMGGTVVGYAGPAGDLTIVIEKMDAAQSLCERGSRSPSEVQVTTAENATFFLSHLTDAIANHETGLDATIPLKAFKSLAVWRSHFGGSEQDGSLFIRQQDVDVINGTVSLEIQPNFAYTLSTIRTAAKGQTETAAVGRFPDLYTDSFDNCKISSIPQYIAPMAGSFDCVEAGGGRLGRSIKQSSPSKAICDRGDAMPFAIIGDAFRTTYTVSVDILLPKSEHAMQYPGAFVGARVKGAVGACKTLPSNCSMDGVFFAVNASGWHITLSIGQIGGTSLVLAAGLLPTTQNSNTLVGTWKHISLAVSGVTAQAAIDGILVATSIAIPAPYEHFTSPVEGKVVSLGKGGYAAFGTVGYASVEFDNIRIDNNIGNVDLANLHSFD